MSPRSAPHPSAPAGQSAGDARQDDLQSLRRLLLRDELARLEALQERLGGDAQLERSVSGVLAGAMTRASEERGREFAQALAPGVVRALAERSSAAREDVAEALRPIAPLMATSAWLARYQRIDERVSGWFRLRARERATQDSAPARVERILLLERGSGLLTASWSRRGDPGEKADLIGGLIAAITAFARDALGERQLRALDFGDRRVYLRMSGDLIAAAQIDCELAPAQERALDARFLELLVRQRSGAQVDEAQLAAAAQEISAARGRPKSAVSWIVAQALAMCVLAGGGALGLRTGLRLWTERCVTQAVEQFLSARPEAALIPLGVAVDHDSLRIELRLIVGPKALGDAEALRAAAAAAVGAEYRIVTRLAQSAVRVTPADDKPKR